MKQEIYAENRFGDGRDWYTIEGACFWKHADTCYLLYSANAYINEDYFIGTATSEPEADLKMMKWSKYPDAYTYQPLMMRNGAVEGTGHNTITKASNLVEDWIVYHGRDASVPINHELEERQMRMDPIFYSGIKMFTNGPSEQPQDAPALPDIYERRLKLDKEDFCLTGQRPFYIAEVWLKAEYSPDGARYGMHLNWLDRSNFIEVVFHSGLNNVAAIVTDGGILQSLEEFTLPKDYDHFVFHQLRVEKTFNHYRIAVDEAEALDFTYEMATGVTGISIHYTGLIAEGLAVTRHCELWRSRLCDLKKFYNISPKAILTEKGLLPDSNGFIELQHIWPYAETFSETFSLSPRGAENSFIIEAVTSDGNAEVWCRVKNISEDETVYIKINGFVGWILSGGKNPILLKTGNGPRKIAVQIKNMVITGYSHTVNNQS